MADIATALVPMVINMPALPQMGEFEVMKAMATAVAYSGFLTSNAPRNDIVQRTADALFVMVMGRELGIPPMTAIKTIYVIDGKPTMSGQAMLSLVRRAGCVVGVPDPGKVTDSVTVTFTRPGCEPREYTYTLAMAEKAGLTGKGNWKKHTAEMLTWRAISTAARFEAPDVIGGLYLVEEINPDIEVNDQGDVITIPSAVQPPSPVPPVVPQPIATKIEDVVEPAKEKEGQHDTPPVTLPAWLTGEKAQDNRRAVMTKIMQELNLTTETIEAELKLLLGMDEPHKLESWAGFKLGKDAVTAAVEANKKRMLAMKPAEPKEKPVYGGTSAPAVTTDMDAEMDRLIALWWDSELGAVLLPDVVKAALDVGDLGWSGQYTTLDAAKNALLQYAVKRSLPIIVSRISYRHENKKQYVELSNGQLIARLYGRDQLRDKRFDLLSEDWLNKLNALKDGDVIDLNEPLCVRWASKTNYFLVPDGGIDLLSMVIPF